MTTKLKDTASDFDQLIGKIGDDRRSDLSEFLGIDLVPETIEDAEEQHNLYGWRDHWKSMPDFESDPKSNFKQIKVTFRTEEDYLAFQKLIGQTLTMKTNSIFYPYKENNKMTLLRWIDDEYDDGGITEGESVESDDAEGEMNAD